MAMATDSGTSQLCGSGIDQRSGCVACVVVPTHCSRYHVHGRANQHSYWSSHCMCTCICRPCRDDISCLIKNNKHQPRWKRTTNISCCMPGCVERVFSHTKVASGEELLSIANKIGCSAGAHITFLCQLPCVRVITTLYIMTYNLHKYIVLHAH